MAIVPAFSEKRIDEDKTYSFDFVNELASGETISGATFTATVFLGTDASPSSIVSGSASTSGTVASQMIVDGVEGVTYLLECEITTSNSQKIHGVGLLKVTDAVKAA
jgi:hypothetical protein